MPQPDETITGPDGQTRMWQPDTKNLEAFNYLGANSGYQSAEEAIQADLDGGQGSWVPASFAHENGLSPWKIVAGMALAGTGGQLLATYGIPALISAFSGGGAAAGGAVPLATSAGVPTGIGVGAAPTGALIAGTGSSILPAAMGGTAAATGGTGMGVAGTTLSRLGTAGQILSRASEGAASGREAEAKLDLGRDTLRQRQAEQERQNAIDQGKLQLDQKTTGQNLETQARKQAAWGQFLQAGPSTITPPAHIQARMGTVSGGVPDWSKLGQDAYSAAQERLLSGSDKQFMPQPNVPTPGLTPLPNESRGDNWMGKAGTILGLINAFRK